LSGAGGRGLGAGDVIAGRGMAVGDLFNDGKLDAVINVMDGHPVLLRNVNPDHNHWLELKLVGGPKSPRDAVGATVYVTANGMKQRGDVLSGGSYLSTNDPRPHFGLGQATTVDASRCIGPAARWRLHRARRGPHCDDHRGNGEIAREVPGASSHGGIAVSTFRWRARFSRIRADAGLSRKPIELLARCFPVFSRVVLRALFRALC
jgi:hypothetical protein